MTPADIAALRARLGLSPAAFALRVGVAERTVTRWETGESVPRNLALKRLHTMARRARHAAIAIPPATA